MRVVGCFFFAVTRESKSPFPAIFSQRDTDCTWWYGRKRKTIAWHIPLPFWYLYLTRWFKGSVNYTSGRTITFRNFSLSFLCRAHLKFLKLSSPCRMTTQLWFNHVRTTRWHMCLFVNVFWILVLCQLYAHICSLCSALSHRFHEYWTHIDLLLGGKLHGLCYTA